ncbi:MAG: protein kinase [Candidatus Beckwithbacteria bacterium]|nr:protein kinase [Candidatus Beckwithbacteria bacterium]
MAQEIFLPSLGINCRGEALTENIVHSFIKGIGLPEKENNLVLLSDQRFRLKKEIVLNSLVDDQESLLGSGAYSWIIPGYDNETKREVALKMMKWSFANDDSVVEGFAREARLMLALDHPNILPIYGLTVINVYVKAIPAIIMEKADGNLQDERNLSPQLISEAVLSIAGVLDYLKEKKVVYADVCPSNILIKEKNFFLGDFGSSIDLSGVDRILSHWDYASPELMRCSTGCMGGRRAYPHDLVQADQHALAAMAFELLTQESSMIIWRTLGGEGATEHREPNIVLNSAGRLDPEIYRVLSKATSYDHKNRYGSCVDFALALKEVIGD